MTFDGLLTQLLYVITKDVGRLSDKFPVSAKTNRELRKEPVEISAVENSTNGKSMISLTAGKTVTTHGKQRRGEMLLNGDDRLRQSQSPDRVGNGKHAEIGVEEIDMNQIEQLSPGSNRSLGESRNAKRQKKSNSSEAYGYECGFCHSSEVTDVSPEFEFNNIFVKEFLYRLSTDVI